MVIAFLKCLNGSRRQHSKIVARHELNVKNSKRSTRLTRFSVKTDVTFTSVCLLDLPGFN